MICVATSATERASGSNCWPDALSASPSVLGLLGTDTTSAVPVRFLDLVYRWFRALPLVGRSEGDAALEKCGVKALVFRRATWVPQLILTLVHETLA